MSQSSTYNYRETGNEGSYFGRVVRWTACASALFVGAGLGIAHEITLDDAINGVISDNNWDSQTLHTGAHPDNFLARGGDDDLVTRGGKDLIDAGPGADWAEGGPDGDRVLGDAGQDGFQSGGSFFPLDGGMGHDKVNGHAYGDIIAGGPGNDEIRGGTHNDLILADDGDRDQIWGGDGNFDECDIDGKDVVMDGGCEQTF